MPYEYKTLGGVDRKIRSLQNSVRVFSANRGSAKGTFWKDLCAVDEAIRSFTSEIKRLQSVRQAIVDKHRYSIYYPPLNTYKQ